MDQLIHNSASWNQPHLTTRLIWKSYDDTGVVVVVVKKPQSSCWATLWASRKRYRFTECVISDAHRDFWRGRLADSRDIGVITFVFENDEPKCSEILLPGRNVVYRLKYRVGNWKAFADSPFAWKHIIRSWRDQFIL